jgi:hypothetical protein
LDDKGYERLGVVCAVSDDIITHVTGHQVSTLRNVMPLSTAQRRAQRVAERIDAQLDLGTEATTATPQGLGPLTSTFLKSRPRMDERGSLCYQPSRFPYLDPPRSGPAFAPTRLGLTSVHSVCTCCSTCHRHAATNAAVRRFGGPIVHLLRSGDTHFLAQYAHAGRSAEKPGFWSTGHLVE